MLQRNQSAAGLEVVTDRSGAGMEVANPYYDGLEAYRTENNVEVGADPKYLVPDPDPRFRLDTAIPWTRPWQRQTWLKIGAAASLLLIVIVIAVVAGVLGSRAHSGASITTPAGTTMPAGIANITIPGALLNNTALASVAWPGTATCYRVYYQTEDLMIRESAWNATTDSWYVSNTGIGQARNGTPLAVAVKRQANGVGFSINLFSIDSSGHVNEWVTTDTFNWVNGSLNSHGLVPAPTSKLAAEFSYGNGSYVTPSLLFVYEDTNNNFQLCNATNTDYTASFDTWSFTTVPAKPTPGSSVALVSLPIYDYPWQLRLFYQDVTNNLVAADWVSGEELAGQGVTGKSVGWNINENNPLGVFDASASLAAFCYGITNNPVESYGSETYFPTIVQAVYSGASSIWDVAWIPNGYSTWLAPSTTSALQSVQAHSPVAAHAWGGLYAIRDGKVVEFEILSAGTDWKYKDLVPTS